MAAKRQRINEHTEEEAIADKKDFISKEAHELCNKILFDKNFVGERGFGKLIPPFPEVIEKEVGDSSLNTRLQDFLLLPGSFMKIWWA